MAGKREMAKAGRLLLVDHGEYSDYTVIGFFVVLRCFDPIDELEKHLMTRPEDEKYFNYDAYLAYLIEKGLLLEVNFSTLYLGDYGNAKSVAFSFGSETSTD